MERIILDIDAGKKAFSVIKKETEGVIGVVDYALDEHMRDATYKKDVFDSENSLIFGTGPLAGSIIPGTARLVFASRSPLTETFFLSTLGGAGLPLYHAGVDLVKLHGKSDTPQILVISNTGNGVEVEFHPISYDNLVSIFKKKSDRGIYNLQDHVIKNFKDLFKVDDKYVSFRILAVGPSALHTNMGAICSTLVEGGEFVEGVDGWAGRGGFGSIMASGHNIAAVIYGGNADDKVFPKADLKDRKVVDSIFEKKFSKSMAIMANEATEKYRFVKKDNTGGTFGVNMTTLGTWLPMFNWSSVYMPTDVRMRIYDTFVKRHYLSQFNNESIKTRAWKTCGEPCPGLCKKIYKGKKKDYEAYEAFGPNCGIFDQRHAEMISDAIEGMGFDAIGFGNIVSFVLECLYKGLLKPEDIGVDIKSNFNADTFALSDSKNHAVIGSKIAIDVAYNHDGFGRMFRKGLRSAVIALSDKYRAREKSTGISFRDIANYVPFGDTGYIAPVQYWVPGFYIPLPIQGKFFTHYGMDFHTPVELGRIAAERSIKELYSENTGICRFHRSWSETLVQDLIGSAYGIDIDYFTHCQKILQGMLNYDKLAGVVPKYWETARTKDVIGAYIKETISVFGENEKSKLWAEKYSKDPEKASREYWQDLLEGVNGLLDWRK